MNLEGEKKLKHNWLKLKDLITDAPTRPSSWLSFTSLISNSIHNNNDFLPLIT